MLILSRRENQELRIGDDIQIKVLHLNGGQVRLGIIAPRDISVHREEIYTKIQQEKLDEHTTDIKR
jgi:carbon storage regulator